MADARIAVTGVKGELGRRVATRLADRTAFQRLIVRDPGRAPEIEGADVAVASDYGAGDEMRAALEGIDTLLLVPGRESRDPRFVGPDGVIRGPADEGHLAPVARDDLADVAVAVLLGSEHDGAALPVTGAQRFTLAEAAAEL